MVSIQFCGGAKFVTGANYLISNGKYSFLVDCGMIQGDRESEMLNGNPFPFNPAEVSFLIATHTHIDHIGRIPKLVRDGFNSPIYSTYPTRDFAEISLLDAEAIMQYDKTKLPIYDEKDVIDTMNLWRGIDYGHKYQVNSEISFVFHDAGHILGSAITEVFVYDEEQRREVKIVFSGDLGNVPSVLLRKYEYIQEADYVLIESAYGDRVHEAMDERKAIIRKAIEDVISRKSVLLMPIFSIERTQDILYELNSIIENYDDTGKKSLLNQLGHIDIYLDSPLAIKATEIHKRYSQYYNAQARKLSLVDDVFEFPYFTMTGDREQSMAINQAPQPKMIMAGSGMSTGGRILYHEERYISDSENIILFVGYQSPGTLGRRILDGEREVVIRGHRIANNIEVRRVDGYSGHADKNMLLDWITHIQGVKKVFVVQGEEQSAESLAAEIRVQMKTKVVVPEDNQVIQLID